MEKYVSLLQLLKTSNLLIVINLYMTYFKKLAGFSLIFSLNRKKIEIAF